MSHQERIDELRKELRMLITDWQPNGNMPPNFHRCDGLGNILVTVDVWCGHYQNPHFPRVIGWQAQIGNQSHTELLSVDDYPSSADAIADAKVQADRAYNKLAAECGRPQIPQPPSPDPADPFNLEA